MNVTPVEDPAVRRSSATEAAAVFIPVVVEMPTAVIHEGWV
jgi:hypothetical protein